MIGMNGVPPEVVFDENNKFRYVESELMIGGRGINLSTPELIEAAILNSINFYLETTNLTVSEEELIIFKFHITQYGLFRTHTRKYTAPNLIGKGAYAPLSATITASDLEVSFIETSYTAASPVNIESNSGNVVFDLGDITGQDYLAHVNTVSNATYPTGYPLTDNSKIYYFKYVDAGVTYMHYFDEENSVNSYETYGIDGNFTFVSTDLVLFYDSSLPVVPVVPVADDYFTFQNSAFVITPQTNNFVRCNQFAAHPLIVNQTTGTTNHLLLVPSFQTVFMKIENDCYLEELSILHANTSDGQFSIWSTDPNSQTLNPVEIIYNNSISSEFLNYNFGTSIQLQKDQYLHFFARKTSFTSIWPCKLFIKFKKL